MPNEIVPSMLQRQALHKKGYIFGAGLSIKGYIMALHGLVPISQLIRPEDVSELRRVLGIFFQHKDGLLTSGQDSKPLHCLTQNSVKWDWSENASHVSRN